MPWNTRNKFLGWNNSHRSLIVLRRWIHLCWLCALHRLERNRHIAHRFLLQARSVRDERFQRIAGEVYYGVLTESEAGSTHRLVRAHSPCANGALFTAGAPFMCWRNVPVSDRRGRIYDGVVAGGEAGVPLPSAATWKKRNQLMEFV